MLGHVVSDVSRRDYGIADICGRNAAEEMGVFFARLQHLLVADQRALGPVPRADQPETNASSLHGLNRTDIWKVPTIRNFCRDP